MSCASAARALWLFTYLPPANVAGCGGTQDVSIEFFVTDTGGNRASEIVPISVLDQPSGSTPVLLDPADRTVSAGTLVQIQLWASDADGDTLSHSHGAARVKFPALCADPAPVECFHHEGRPAVGSCRACFRGLCRVCAADLGRGLACAGRCEEAARALIASLDQSIRLQGLSGSMMQGARTLWVGITGVALVVGVIVIGLGLSLPQFRSIALLGIPFLAIGCLTGLVLRRVRRGAGVS